MGLFRDKRGFLDTEVLFSLGFIILFGLALAATMIGYILSKRAGWEAFPIWQLLVIIVGEFFAAYIFVARS